MKLTFEEIKATANGYARIEHNELGLEFHRFSREQESFFYKTHPLYCGESFFNGYFGRNCRTSAGITLDFVCDAKAIRIDFGQVEYPNGSKVQLFDLYVDREFAGSYPTDEKVLYQASGKEQRFTLYFPYFAFPVISSVELIDATVFLPIKKPVDILFLGDSITHGGNAVHPSNTYVMRVARNLDIGILNQGNSGFVYDAGSVDKVCDPKIVVTAYGINDYGRKSIELLEGQAIDFLKAVRSAYKDAKILSVLPLWTAWDGDDPNFRLAERTCLKSIYEEYSDYIVDGHKMIPHDKKYFEDGLVHPNDEGFEFYGNNLTEELKKALERD